MQDRYRFAAPSRRENYGLWLTAIDEARTKKDSKDLLSLLNELEELESAWADSTDSLSETSRTQGRLGHLVYMAKEALVETGSAENLITLPNNLLTLPKSDIIIVEFGNITQGLIHQIAERPTDIYNLSPRKFEELIAEILKGMGWDVQITAATRDGGYDVLGIVKDVSGANLKTSYLIECKRYSPQRKVGISIVRELLYVKSEMRVANALIATTSDFSAEVYSTKNKRYDLELRNRDAIIEWCRAYKERNGVLHNELIRGSRKAGCFDDQR